MYLAFFILLVPVFSQDYYQLLGVSRTADEKTIKKAFKKLSLEQHPDRGDEHTEKNYMKLSQAYEVLTNPAKREVYDRFGEEGITVGAMKYDVDEVYDNYFGFSNPNMRYGTVWLYEDTPVIEIKDNNLKSLYRRNEIWMLKFYGPRSQLSHNFKHEWSALAGRLENIAKVAAVNCDENEDLCKEYNVKKYPAIVFFPESTILDHEPYSGPRDFNSMHDFVLSKISGFLRFVNKNNFEEFTQTDPEQVKLISVTNQKESVPLIKVLSREYKGKVVFGETKANDQELIQKLGVRGFPSLVLVTLKDTEVYNGDFTRRSLEIWIDEKIGKHQVFVLAKELTRSLYGIGNCNFSDNRFCFIFFDPDSEVKGVLHDLAERFSSDPVSVFWVNSEKYPKVKESFSGNAVIVRGKKQKHSVVECEGKYFKCFREAIDDALAGSRSFARTKPEPDFSETKSDL